MSVDTKGVDTKGVLDRLDAAIEGRCAGPGCTTRLTERSASLHFCSQTCQDRWNLARTDRPEEVHGTDHVDPTPARWRPDLVSAFDESGLRLVTELTAQDRREADVMDRGASGFTWSGYRHRDGRYFVRVDDGHRWVGAFTDGTEEAGRVMRARLERELTDRRRLDPDPLPMEDYGPVSCHAVLNVHWYRDSSRPPTRLVYQLDDAMIQALRRWLTVHGIDPDDVPTGPDHTVVVRDGELILDRFVRGPDGEIAVDRILGGARTTRITVPLMVAAEYLRHVGRHMDGARTTRITVPLVEPPPTPSGAPPPLLADPRAQSTQEFVAAAAQWYRELGLAVPAPPTREAAGRAEDEFRDRLLWMPDPPASGDWTYRGAPDPNTPPDPSSPFPRPDLTRLSDGARRWWYGHDAEMQHRMLTLARTTASVSGRSQEWALETMIQTALVDHEGGGERS